MSPGCGALNISNTVYFVKCSSFFAFGREKVSCVSRELYAAASVAVVVFVSLGFCFACIVKYTVRVTCLSADRHLWPSFSAFTSSPVGATCLFFLPS